MPRDLRLVLESLVMWQYDPGDTWGEAARWFEYKDWLIPEPTKRNVRPTAPDYATVPTTQPKCTTYVAEVVYRAFGHVDRTIPETKTAVRKGRVVETWRTGRWFPHRADAWGDPDLDIPHFAVVSDPKMGDIWASENRKHVGVYLGTYAGQPLYVSARLDSDGVFGRPLQPDEGIQIKIKQPGGTFRRYTP